VSGSDTPIEGAARIARLISEAEQARRRGNLREAALTLLDAAQIVDTKLPPHEREVQRQLLSLRAADCYIRDGALGQGWQLLRQLLEQCDVQPPNSPAKALLGSTWRRGRYLLGDAELEGEPRSRTPADELRLLVLDGAARSLTLVSTTLADALRTRHLREVGRFGAASDRCRALASEIAMQTRMGGSFDRSVKRLLDRCAQLARETGEPLDEAWRQLALATYEFSHGRWKKCVEACEQATEIFAALADEGLDISHERSRVAALHWFALAWLGELAQLRERLDQAILEAETHKDSLMLLEALTGQPVLVWLAADEAELVRARARKLLERHRAVAKAAWPENSYRRQQYRDLMAEVHACLYLGTPAPAWAACVGQWRELEGAHYLPMRTVGLELRSARARVGLALVEQFDRDAELTRARLLAQPGLASTTWDRDRLLADVKTMLEQLRRDQSCVAPAMSSLLDAAIHYREGRREDAQVALDTAVRQFNSVDMALHRECARYALGELIGGGEGGQLQDQAEAWMRRQKVVFPRKLAASQAPGFELCNLV
jgi:hypothetical protein